MTHPSNQPLPHDDTRPAAIRFHESEAGFISVVNVVAILLCTVLMGLVVNSGNIVRHKIEAQNAADATAYTSALWHARGMNTITMTNHVMGEVNAFVVLHEAIGGKDLDDTNQKNATAAADMALEITYNTAQVASIAPIDEFYDTVRQEDGIEAERTLLDSKKQLKTILATVYGVKTVAGGLENFPYTAAIGYALDVASTLAEAKVYQEYIVLKAIHKVASALKPVSQALQNVVLPAMKGYLVAVRAATPGIAQLAALEVAEKNGTEGFVYHSWLMLPVEDDPVGKNLNSNSPDSDVAKTQLVRATYPWVTFHRKPIIDFMWMWLTFSGAAVHYEKHTNECTIEVSKRLQTDNIIQLYVMQGDKQPDKGHEDWTTDSTKADNMFSVVGFIHQPQPPVVSPVIYPNTQSDGLVTYAQAMFYNANPQEPLASKQKRQAALGWDTLNWEGRPVEHKTDDAGTEFPKIKLNWQAKLVPVTNNRMLQAQPVAMLQNRYRKVLQRTVGLSPMTQH